MSGTASQSSSGLEELVFDTDGRRVAFALDEAVAMPSSAPRTCSWTAASCSSSARPASWCRYGKTRTVRATPMC